MDAEHVGATLREAHMASEQIPPEWWHWDLSFTAHAELRMEQRGVSEVDVRAMLARAATHEPSVVIGRHMIYCRHRQHAWRVIVEPDVATRRLIVVTAYEVSL